MSFSIIFTFFFIGKQNASADIINPEFFTKQCPSNETEVTCSVRSTEPFGQLTFNGCSKYDADPNYRFLVQDLHSFGGSKKYCTQTIFSTSEGLNMRVVSNIALNTFYQLLGTLFFELPVFLLLGFRRRKDILYVVLVNVLSVTLFVLFGLAIALNIYLVILAEVLIIIFEAFLLYKYTKYPLQKVIKATAIANVISATFGTVLFLNYPSIRGIMIILSGLLIVLNVSGYFVRKFMAKKKAPLSTGEHQLPNNPQTTTTNGPTK